MWTLPDTLARRFPLIARPRPACPPLPQRVHGLTQLADTAAKLGDPTMASAVYNQAALIASDVGVAEDARTWCRQHASAYLHAGPLTGRSAIHALEPVVNLARLRIRAEQHDAGLQALLALFAAVSAASPLQVEGIAVPAALTRSPEDRSEVRAWLWRVLLSDGTRALTAAGRWAEALAHAQEYRGVGKRMLDGRQVAILAALTTGDTDSTAALLTETGPGEPWEQAVTACLTVLCRQAVERPVEHHLAELVSTYLSHQAGHGTAVFDIRLGLTVLDTIGSAETPATHRIVENLYHRTAQANDGYAARETLAHPLFATLATDQQIHQCRNLVHVCALDSGTLPAELQGSLAEALRIADQVIRRSVQDHPNR